MGLFSRKKEEKTSKVLDISSAQLLNILNKAILLAEEDVNAKSYTFGPEIMFDYNNTVHFIGVKYDKKRAKALNQKNFCKEFMSVYLDKQEYKYPEELFENADIKGIKFKDINSGILVSQEYGELL